MFDRYGIGTTVWSPLKYGLLSGKYSAASAPEAGTRFAMDQYQVRRSPDPELEDAPNTMICCVTHVLSASRRDWCGGSKHCHYSAHQSCAVIQEIWKKQLTEDNLKKVDGLRPIAEELGCSMAQLALAWAASNPDVSTVITGASKPQQASVTHPYKPLALLRCANEPGVCINLAHVDGSLVCKCSSRVLCALQVEDNMKAISYISKIDSVRDKIEAVMANKPEPTQKSY